MSPKDLAGNMNYRQEMKDFVQNINTYSKNIKQDFAIIAQNGVELVSVMDSDKNLPDLNYINSIDGIGIESLNYGYNADNKKTPNPENKWTQTFLNMLKYNSNVKIMITDYCSTQSKIDNSYTINNKNNFISFSADKRELDNIPNYPRSIYNENNKNITSIQEAKNFLYLINPDNEYATKQGFINAVKNTNYDYIIMDFFYDGQEYTATEIKELKQKANGGKRLLICYLSIGEAESYRYYWQPNWSIGNPSFIVKENPNWTSNYVVKYWDKKWQNIIFGNDNSYLKKIIDTGFNGAYLDIIDAFEYFEN